MEKTSAIVFVMFLFFTFQVFGQNLEKEQLESAKKLILNKTDTIAIQKLKNELEPKIIKNKQEAAELFKKKGYPTRKVFKDGKVIELQGFENGRPYFYTTYNNVAAKTVSTNKVKPGGELGLNLRGENIDIGLWDESSAYTYHTEFKETNNGPYHVYYTDTAAQVFGNHPTHVAGTLVAWGKQSDAKGMAEKANVRSYNWNMDLSEMSNEVIYSQLLLSNHSYGKIAGWNKQDTSWYWIADDFDVIDPAFGDYDSSAWNLDKLAYLSPYYNIVFAAGNQRDEGPEDNAFHYVWIDGEYAGSTKFRPKDGINGFKSIAHEAIAKNIIVVGAIDDIPAGYQTVTDVKQENAVFSSWGPTNDGRIKPDIVANGDNLYSTLSGGDNYGSMSETSMAAPNVTGSLALLLQHYYQTHNNSFPLASTIKAIIVHTADEAGSAIGPDAKYGWGLLNTANAAKIISEDQSRQNIIYLMDKQYPSKFIVKERNL